MSNCGEMWQSNQRQGPGRRGLVWTLLLLGGLWLSGCGALSLEEELQLGEEQAAQLDREMGLVDDQLVVDYVNGLVAGLLEVRPATSYEFNTRIIDNAGFNAFAIAGGHLYLTTGVLLGCRNVAELASVLAHEIAHVERGHIRANFRRFRNSQAAADITAITLAVLTGNPFLAGAGDLAANLGSTVYISAHTREAERDADATAFQILVDAGYDPRSQLTLMARLQAAGAGQEMPMPFLLSHPLPEERMEDTRARLAELDSLRMLRVNDDGRLQEIQARLAP